MSDRLAEIRARLIDATMGPFGTEKDWEQVKRWAALCASSDIEAVQIDDTRFIAHAPADIAWLLEQVEELTKRVRMYEVVKS
jgi:hypothetical protein